MTPMAAPLANWLPRNVVMYMSSAGTSVWALSGPAMAKTRSKIFRLMWPRMIIAERVMGAMSGRMIRAVELPVAGAVHDGRLPQLLGDAAQARQVEGHGVARHLPDGGDDDADEREVEPVQLGEVERRPGAPERRAPTPRSAAAPAEAIQPRRRLPVRKARKAATASAAPARSAAPMGRRVPVETPDLLPRGEPGELARRQPHQRRQPVDAAAGLQQPAPDGPGDHEREREGEEEDCCGRRPPPSACGR